MPSTPFMERAQQQRQPETFGRYQLIGRLAIGGMAEVFIARSGELTGLQALIALKRILPVHASDESFVRMFQREAAIALRLNHSSIARVFEVGKVGESWFLSMELVQGENLARISKKLSQMQMRWPADVLAYVGSEVARALHYAHRLKDVRGKPLGIIHRDISPENVMCGFDGSVKVIDFGIALCEAHARETTAGAVRGKAQYVSPEQAMGRELDNRSDLFSLGVVLYEALSGHHPFDRGAPMATLDAIVKDSVPPIPQVSQAFNRVLARALQKDRDRRYQTADAFATDLLGTISHSDRVGANQVQDLATSLFPGRTSRWRMMQDVGGSQSSPAASPSPSPQPAAPVTDVTRASPPVLSRERRAPPAASSPKPAEPAEDFPAEATLVDDDPSAGAHTGIAVAWGPVRNADGSTARLDPPGYVGALTASVRPDWRLRRRGMLAATASAAAVVCLGVLALGGGRGLGLANDVPTAQPSLSEAPASAASAIAVEQLDSPPPETPPAEAPPPAAPTSEASVPVPRATASAPIDSAAQAKASPIPRATKRHATKRHAVKRSPVTRATAKRSVASASKPSPAPPRRTATRRR